MCMRVFMSELFGSIGQSRSLNGPSHSARKMMVKLKMIAEKWSCIQLSCSTMGRHETLDVWRCKLFIIIRLITCKQASDFHYFLSSRAVFVMSLVASSSFSPTQARAWLAATGELVRMLAWTCRRRRRRRFRFMHFRSGLPVGLESLSLLIQRQQARLFFLLQERIWQESDRVYSVKWRSS